MVYLWFKVVGGDGGCTRHYHNIHIPGGMRGFHVAPYKMLPRVVAHVAPIRTRH